MSAERKRPDSFQPTGHAIFDSKSASEREIKNLFAFIRVY
jgi:hypothetical protein